MTRLIFVLTIAAMICATCVADYEEKCAEDKEYKSCGTECPPTCENKEPVCIQMCSPGCFCKDGWYLDSYGNCVSSCP